MIQDSKTQVNRRVAFRNIGHFHCAILTKYFVDIRNAAFYVEYSVSSISRLLKLYDRYISHFRNHPILYGVQKYTYLTTRFLTIRTLSAFSEVLVDPRFSLDGCEYVVEANFIRRSPQHIAAASSLYGDEQASMLH